MEPKHKNRTKRKGLYVCQASCVWHSTKCVKRYFLTTCNRPLMSGVKNTSLNWYVIRITEATSKQSFVIAIDVRCDAVTPNMQ